MPQPRYWHRGFPSISTLTYHWQYPWGVGRSQAHTPLTVAAERGQGHQWRPWSPGGGHILASGITIPHETCAWVETVFVSWAEESRRKWQNLDWRLKVQVLVFSLSPYWGADGLTVSYIFDVLDLIYSRGDQIWTIHWHSSSLRPSLTSLDIWLILVFMNFSAHSRHFCCSL